MEIETRIKIWEGAKEDLYTGKYAFICQALVDRYWNHFKVFISVYEAFELFPEALKYEPKIKRSTNIWFTVDEVGCKKRIEICNKVIKELKAQL